MVKLKALHFARSASETRQIKLAATAIKVKGQPPTIKEKLKLLASRRKVTLDPTTLDVRQAHGGVVAEARRRGGRY